VGEEFAFIRLRDLWRPWRFLRQMAGAPPIRFGVEGFNPDLVDDANPVRHYVAFVVTGFWLPRPLATWVLYSWELLGFVRYRGYWSPRDMACGRIGITHGAQVRKRGPGVLAGMVRRDLSSSPVADVSGETFG